MSEPLKTQPNKAGTGRDEYSDEQYKNWLDDMRSFLKEGSTLYYAMDKAGLAKHKNVIYRKYKKKDWFWERITTYQGYVGELINKIGVKTITKIHTRLVETDGFGAMTKEEMQVWKHMASTHRAAQPFFVNRTESAEADDDDLGKVIERMESSDYEDVAEQAKKQILAANPPVQDQEQTRPAGDVQTEHNAVEASSGTGQPPV